MAYAKSMRMRQAECSSKNWLCRYWDKNGHGIESNQMSKYQVPAKLAKIISGHDYVKKQQLDIE